MTQDEPERAKIDRKSVESFIGRKLTPATNVAVLTDQPERVNVEWFDLPLAVKMRQSAKENSVFSHLRQALLLDGADFIESMFSAMSVSEKRAETLEREICAVTEATLRGGELGMSDKITTARIAQIKANEIAELRKLYGDKSEQYVAERLAHEETRKALAAAEKRAEELAERLAFSENRAVFWNDAALGFQAELKATRQERDSSQASLLRVVEALKQCAERFKEYGVAHMAKQPPDIDKAKRNYEMFDLCRTALSPHKET